MRTRSLLLALALTMVVSGCGRAASTSVDLAAEPDFVPHMLTERRVIPQDKIRPDVKPPVGVKVNGRVYPKGEAPTVAATPAPEAPAAGKGHMHVWISLSKRTVRTEALRLVANVAGEDAELAVTFDKDMLVGTDLDYTFTDLAPGEYELRLERQVTTGHWHPAGETEGTVEADASQTVKIF